MADCGLQEYERFNNTNFFELEPTTNVLSEKPLTEPNKTNSLITRVGNTFIINSVRASLLTNTFSIFLGKDDGSADVVYQELKDIDGNVVAVQDSVPIPVNSFFDFGVKFYYFYNDVDDNLVLRYYDDRSGTVSNEIVIAANYTLESAQLVEDMFVLVVTKSELTGLFDNIDRIPTGKRLIITLAEKNLLEYVISNNASVLDYDIVNVPFNNIAEQNRTVINKVDADSGYLVFSGQTLEEYNSEHENGWNLKKALNSNLHGPYVPRESYITPTVNITSSNKAVNGTVFEVNKSKTGIWVDKDISDKTLYCRLQIGGNDATPNDDPFNPDVSTINTPGYDGRRRLISSWDKYTELLDGRHWALYKSGTEIRLEITTGLLDVITTSTNEIANILQPDNSQRASILLADTAEISAGNERITKTEGSVFAGEFEDDFLNLTLSLSNVKKETLLRNGRTKVFYDAYVKATLSRTRTDGTQVWVEMRVKMTSNSQVITENIFVNADHQYNIKWDYFSAEKEILAPELIRDVHYVFDGNLTQDYNFEPDEPFMSDTENIKPVNMAENVETIKAYIYKYFQEFKLNDRLKSFFYSRKSSVLPLRLDAFKNTLLYQLTKKNVYEYLRIARTPEQVFNRNPFILDVGANNSNYTLWVNMEGLYDKFFIQMFNKTLSEGNVLNVKPMQQYDTLSHQTYDKDRYYVVYHFDEIQEDPDILLSAVNLINDKDLYFIGTVTNGTNDNLNRNYMNKVDEVYLYKPEHVYKSSYFNIEIDAREKRDRDSFINNIGEIQDFAEKVVEKWKPAHTHLEKIHTKDTLIMANLFNDEFSQVILGFSPDDNTLAYYLRTNERNKFGVFTANSFLNTRVDWIAMGKINTPYVKSGMVRLKRNVNNFKIFFESEFPDRNYRAFVYSPNNTKLFIPAESLDTDGFIVEGAAPYKDELAWFAVRTNDVVNGMFDWKAPKPWSGEQIINTVDIFFPVGRLIEEDYSIVISTDVNVNIWLDKNSKYDEDGNANIKVDNTVAFLDGTPNKNYLNEGQFFTLKRSSYEPVKVSWMAIPSGAKWWLDIRGK